MKKYVLASLVVFSSLLMSSAPLVAAQGKSQPAPSPATGNDISWPQCNKTLPKGQAFGIVGVNGGLANTSNPCFTAQLAWANSSVGGTGQAKAALYVNTANPGNLHVASWPTKGTNVYGQCSGGDDQACAYQYGWERALEDATIRNVPNPSSYMWWLDVETVNSWETNTANNVADLEGMVAYFQSIGATVGIYSTAYQWGQIAGPAVTATSNLNGLDSWLAGAKNVSDAQTKCALPGLTANSKVTVVQYIAKQLDYDYSCI